MSTSVPSPAPSPAPAVPMTGPVVTANARIVDIAPTVVAETVSNRIEFTYNPLNETGAFAFFSRAYLYVNAEPQALASTSSNVLQAALTPELLPQTFGNGLADPVTGADLGKISIAGFMIYMKNAFDILYNRRALANAGAPDPNAPFPSQLAILQANALYDLYGNGLGGFPLGKAFGGQGTSDGNTSQSGLPTPPNPFAAPVEAPSAV